MSTNQPRKPGGAGSSPRWPTPKPTSHWLAPGQEPCVQRLAGYAQGLGLSVEVRDKTTDLISGWTFVRVKRSDAPKGSFLADIQDSEWVDVTFAWDTGRRSEKLLAAEERRFGGGVRKLPRTTAVVHQALALLARP